MKTQHCIFVVYSESSVYRKMNNIKYFYLKREDLICVFKWKKKVPHPLVGVDHYKKSGSGIPRLTAGGWWSLV